MLGVIVLLILLALPIIVLYLSYSSAGPDKCGSTACKAPTPFCDHSTCVGCRTDTDCPTTGPRIVHGYSLAAGAVPDRTVDAEALRQCVAAALNDGAAAAQYRADVKKCDLFATATGLTAVAPEDPLRVLVEIGSNLDRK